MLAVMGAAKAGRPVVLPEDLQEHVTGCTHCSAAISSWVKGFSGMKQLAEETELMERGSRQDPGILRRSVQEGTALFDPPRTEGEMETWGQPACFHLSGLQYFALLATLGSVARRRALAWTPAGLGYQPSTENQLGPRHKLARTGGPSRVGPDSQLEPRLRHGIPSQVRRPFLRREGGRHGLRPQPRRRRSRAGVRRGAGPRKRIRALR